MRQFTKNLSWIIIRILNILLNNYTFLLLPNYEDIKQKTVLICSRQSIYSYSTKGIAILKGRYIIVSYCPTEIFLFKTPYNSSGVLLLKIKNRYRSIGFFPCT